MMRAQATVPTTSRRVTVKIAYGAVDVEKAAESMDLQISAEEVGAILANLDEELATLAASATHSAVLSRIFDELLIVSHAHNSGDDD
jgi:hypothetical protein